MRSTKILFALVATSIVGATAMVVAAQAEQRMVPVSTMVKEILSNLDNAIQREIATGCTEKDPRSGQTRFCKNSQEKIDALNKKAFQEIDAESSRPPEARAAAEKAIHVFRKNEKLALTYTATVSNPYTDDEAQIETYVDDQGYEYWVNPKNNILVQSSASTGVYSKTSTARSSNLRTVAELRAQAIEIISTQIPDFNAHKGSLHPLEDNKNRITYFFRWDDFTSPVKESEMAPFVQVGLFADGTLASYTNTLTH